MVKLKTQKCKGYASSFLDKVKKIDEDTANKTFYRYLYDINSDDMSFTAVISDGIQLSVADIFEKADRIADVLTQKGLKAGDSVAEFFLDKFSLLCITLACSKIGVQLIVAHPSLDLKILDNMKEGKNVKMIFCSEARYPFLTSVNVSEIVVLPMTKDCVDDWKNIPVPKGKKVESWNEFLDTETSVEAAEITDNEYPLMALFSTGTTGIPKTIVHTNKSLVAVIFVLSELDMGWKKGDVLLGYPPPFVFTGLIFPVFVPMAMKITLVCDSSNNDLRLSPNGKGVKEQFNFKSVLVYKPNILVVTKSFLLSMITQHNGISLDLSSVKYIVLAGEPLNPQESLIIKNFFKAHGSDVTIENFYGMSEIGGIAYHIEDNSSVLANTVFYPYSIACTFDPETGEELPYNKIGHIYAKTESMMKEYMLDEKSTNEFFAVDDEGNRWACTGDIGYVTEDNIIVVLGRYVENYKDENNNVVFPYMFSDALAADDNVISCKMITRKTEGKDKLVLHVLVKQIPEDTEEYVNRLQDILKRTDSIKIYPDMYKIRTEFPIFRSKISMRDLAAEQDGFIEV